MTNDLVLKEYLELCWLNTNSSSFQKILCFVILYRELICVYKKDSFMENNRPGRLLYFANLFFEYLEELKVIDQLTNDDKIELVEILIHFACWLSNKSLTYNKLFLGFLDTN